MSRFLTAPFFVASSSLDEIAATEVRRFRRLVNAAVRYGKPTALSADICISSGKRSASVSGCIAHSDHSSQVTWRHSLRQLIPSFLTESQMPLHHLPEVTSSRTRVPRLDHMALLLLPKKWNNDRNFRVPFSQSKYTKRIFIYIVRYQ